jgi:hypothetical protein
MTCPVNLGSLPIWCAAAKDGHPLKNPLCHPLCPSLHCDARNFIQTLASDCSVSARSRPISGSSSTTRNQARAGGGTGAVGASTSLNSKSKLERECWLASVRQHENLASSRARVGVFCQYRSADILRFLMLSLWACGQGACVVHHVHSDAALGRCGVCGNAVVDNVWSGQQRSCWES